MTKELGAIAELKRFNPWIDSFQLSDPEIYAVIDLIGQVIWGDMTLEEFPLALQKAVIKDDAAKRRLIIEIAKNRFKDFQDDLGDVDAFINNFQSGNSVVSPVVENSSPKETKNLPPSPAVSALVKPVNSRDEILRQYDWSATTGLERRLLLEELGVSRQELEDYLKSN